MYIYTHTNMFLCSPPTFVHQLSLKTWVFYLGIWITPAAQMQGFSYFYFFNLSSFSFSLWFPLLYRFNLHLPSSVFYMLAPIRCRPMKAIFHRCCISMAILVFFFFKMIQRVNRCRSWWSFRLMVLRWRKKSGVEKKVDAYE